MNTPGLTLTTTKEMTMKLCAIPASDLKIGMSICSQATMLMGEPIAAMRKIVKIKPSLTFTTAMTPALGIE